MIKQNNNNSKSKTSNVLKRDNVQLSVQECNDWIKNNPEKIVNLYLKSIRDQEKKSIQKKLNDLVKNERTHNTSKFMTEKSLGVLKKLTQQNQMSFSSWKQDSEVTHSKISSVAKKISPIQIESIDQFLDRGGEITLVQKSNKKAI